MQYVIIIAATVIILAIIIITTIAYISMNNRASTPEKYITRPDVPKVMNIREQGLRAYDLSRKKYGVTTSGLINNIERT